MQQPCLLGVVSLDTKAQAAEEEESRAERLSLSDCESDEASDGDSEDDSDMEDMSPAHWSSEATTAASAATTPTARQTKCTAEVPCFCLENAPANGTRTRKVGFEPVAVQYGQQHRLASHESSATRLSSHGSYAYSSDSDGSTDSGGSSPQHHTTFAAAAAAAGQNDFVWPEDMVVEQHGVGEETQVAEDARVLAKALIVGASADGRLADALASSPRQNTAVQEEPLKLEESYFSAQRRFAVVEQQEQQPKEEEICTWQLSSNKWQQSEPAFDDVLVDEFDETLRRLRRLKVFGGHGRVTKAAPTLPPIEEQNNSCTAARKARPVLDAIFASTEKRARAAVQASIGLSQEEINGFEITKHTQNSPQVSGDEDEANGCDASLLRLRRQRAYGGPGRSLASGGISFQ
jgi:hypothetical protein